MSDPSSSTSRPSAAPPKPTIRTIPPLVLLSFAVIHSQVYWLYSVFYHLCNNLPDRSLDPSVNDTVRNALTKGSGGRARAFSEPQQASTILLHRRQTTTAAGIAAAAATTTTTKRRPRSTTINASTLQADGPLQRQQWVQRVHACLDEQQQQQEVSIESQQQTVIMDERLGRTRPPRWWQRTKRHLLTRQENRDEESDSSNNYHSNITSTLSLPAVTSTSTVRTSLDSAATNFGMTVTNSTLPHSQSVSPPTCDIQHYHHDITGINATTTTITTSATQIITDTIPLDTSSPPSPPFAESSSDASSLLSSLSTKATISIHGPKPSTVSDEPELPFEQEQQQSQQQPQRRPLAKIRSVFIKSQIEPEKARSLEPKRRTILGIPSRWSNSKANPSAEPTEDTVMVNKKATHIKKRQSVRIQEPHESAPSSPHPKKKLFSSLPNWKRKSVG